MGLLVMTSGTRLRRRHPAACATRRDAGDSIFPLSAKTFVAHAAFGLSQMAMSARLRSYENIIVNIGRGSLGGLLQFTSVRVDCFDCLESLRRLATYVANDEG
jgi:hypothetical protein